MSASLKVVKSATMLLGLQLVQRGLGIVSTLILARLLTPEHFGIVALVAIALQFFELLVETGTQQYIVQISAISDDDLNTAWSMDVLIKSTMALLIIACAPLIALYFDTPELTIALGVSALALPVAALKSPGMMQLIRDINYRPMFRLTLWQKGLSFITVVGLALIHPSYWAIISGNLVSAVVFTVGSYKVHDFRPRWTLVHFRKQWRFSQWLLLRGIVGFTRSQIDNLLVSKLFGTARLGGYNLVRELSLLPALSIFIPMSEPLLAAIAQEKNKAATLSYRIRVSLWLMTSIITPVTIFIMVYPNLIGLAILGPNWIDFLPLLRPFGLFFFSFCLFALICDAMIAQGKVRLLFWLDVISTVIIIIILLETGTESLLLMAWTRGWLAIITTVSYLFILNHQVSFGLPRFFWLCFPALAGSFIGLIAAGLPSFEFNTIFVELLVRGALYVVVSGLATIGFATLLLRNTEEWSQLCYIFQQLKHPQPGNK